MSISKMVVSRPTTIIIVFILLIGLGVFALINLPVDLYPDINVPKLFIITTYPGAGPEEVERSVSRVLEAALSGISGLETVSSASGTGVSSVSLDFTFGTNLDDASLSARDAIDRVRNSLPSTVMAPMIFRFDPAMIPIMGLMVTGNRSPEELLDMAENVIVPRIEQIPGIATASVVGGRETVVRVEIPQNRLEAYGLTVTQIQQSLAAQNMQIAAGTIIENDLSYILTTMGEFNSLEELRSTAITVRGQTVIHLRDIADVFIGFKDETNSVFVNGVPAIMVIVQKQSGKNSIQAARDLRARLTVIERELPPGTKITELFNTTDIIENSLGQVRNSAVLGALLAVIVLFLFLRSWKPTIIIGISIPVCIIITLMLMYFANLTLNMMTMAGLVLGIGMLIDNSIIILERIYYYREKGAKLNTASVIGTQEMTLAITASTLSTLCVFAPLIMFQGLLELYGEMFSSLAFTIVISLAMSIFTALFLVPVLTSRYFPLVTRKQKPLKGNIAKIDGVFEKFFTSLEKGYAGSVSWVLENKALTILGIIFLLAVSVLMIPVVGWVLMPDQVEDNVQVNITLPVGTPLAETESVLRQLEQIVIDEVEAYQQLIMSAGGQNFFIFRDGGSNTGNLRIDLPPFDERIEDAEQIKEILRGYFNDFPGVLFSFGGGWGGGMGGSSPVNIRLRTDDLIRGKALAERIAQTLNEKMSEMVTEPQVSLNDGLPQIEIVLDRERMYALGLNAFAVGNEIRAAVDGIVATRFKADGSEYDVMLILAEADRSTRPALDQIFVNSPFAGRIPLSSFVHYQEGTGPLTINRENQSRIVSVTAGMKPGITANVLQSRLEMLIAEDIPIEEGIMLENKGANEELNRIGRNFALIFIVAIFLNFGTMASIFESFKAPFIIIFTIPLSLVGIVGIYFFTNEPFNILSLVGLLVLVGIMTNNGIVLVDYTNLLRKRGVPLKESCVEAAKNRLRPILMTTVTTLFALVPMAFFPGEGSELVAPISKTVLGGLSFGTLLTLFLMPALYYIFYRKTDERLARAAARRERIAAGDGWKEADAPIKAQEANS